MPMTKGVRVRPLRACVVAMGALAAIVFGSACDEPQRGYDGGDQEQEREQDGDGEREQDGDGG